MPPFPERHRFYCAIGVAKIALGCVLFIVGACLSVADAEGRSTQLALYGIAAAVVAGGHALCQAHCFFRPEEKSAPPPNS